MNNFQSDLVFTTNQQDSPTCSSDVNIAVDDLSDIEMRSKLKRHIIKKTDTIRDKLQYVSLKYDIVKNLFNRYSLTILIVSALITLSDALKLLIIQFITNNNIILNSKTIDFTLNIISLVMGTFMTVIASIIRFQNYREKMEKLKEMQDKFIHIKALYNRELAILKLNKNEEKSLIDEVQEKLSDYDTIVDEVNIISEITNDEMIVFSKKISNFKVSIADIKNNESVKLNSIFSRNA